MSDPARVVTLILSDVVGNPLDVIASGPTVPDPTTYSQALEIVKGASAFGEIPIAVMDYLDRGARGGLPETLKPEDQTTCLGINRIVGSNQVSCDAAAAIARVLGFRAEVLTTSLTGEARQVGAQLAKLAKARANDERPFVLILGGETTVTLRGNGIGGRNLEVALGAVEGFAGLRNMDLVTCATDGEDGTSGCADSSDFALLGDTVSTPAIVSAYFNYESKLEGETVAATAEAWESQTPGLIPRPFALERAVTS